MITIIASSRMRTMADDASKVEMDDNSSIETKRLGSITIITTTLATGKILLAMIYNLLVLI